MRKQKTLAIIAACVLATSCPYAVTAGEIEKQEVTTEVYAASEDVICSGDCSKTSGDDVEWKITKIDDSGKLKLIISGYGDMKDYGFEDRTLPEIIEDELYNLPEDIDFTYISDVEVCEGVQSIGSLFDSADAVNVHMIENQLEEPHASCTISFRWDVEHHPAVTHEEPVYEDVCHPPMTHTVMHPAKTHTEKIWVEE
uniref:hypothetical protein n=1 Tax=Eubacterium cellulosolvens TaxID=29322 RepID=UPI00048968B3|nr:hypothetical protein [[Eubacterium] cellulosolvens]